MAIRLTSFPRLFSVLKWCKKGLENEKLRLRSFSSVFATKRREKVVLGIETSCDDTGAAVVDESGHVLGDALHSQTSAETGGVFPIHAKRLHQLYIDKVVKEALASANLEAQDVDAVAVTNRPGLSLSLEVGLSYAKSLVSQARVPMIPIHHMEAHALTVRMIQEVHFPYLVLLLSGGHCLLAVAREVDDFLLLGTSADGSPGEAFDKVARRLKLKTIPQCYYLCGGAMVETMAKHGDPEGFFAPSVMVQEKSCNFSFSGLKSAYLRYIEEEEERQGIVASGVISNAADLCASFQYAVLKHLVKPLQRAILFCEMRNILPMSSKTLVVSGGVASNKYLRAGLQKVCDHHDVKLICPPPHLCTDNGIMIAWNGMERLLARKGVAPDSQAVDYMPKCPLGENLTTEVQKCTIKLPKIKL